MPADRGVQRDRADRHREGLDDSETRQDIGLEEVRIYPPDSGVFQTTVPSLCVFARSPGVGRSLQWVGELRAHRASPGRRDPYGVGEAVDVFDHAEHHGVGGCDAEHHGGPTCGADVSWLQRPSSVFVSLSARIAVW